MHFLVLAYLKFNNMKPQDVMFFVLGILLLFSRKPKYFVFAGLSCLVLAIPLFAAWVFFTAERLAWYAAVFFFVFIIFSLLESGKVQ